MSNDQNKSLLNTISTGFDDTTLIPQESPKPDFLEESGVSTTFKTGFEKQVEIFKPEKPKKKINKSSVITSMKTGFDGQHIKTKCKKKEKQEEPVALTINTTIDLGYDKKEELPKLKNTIDVNALIRSYKKNSILNNVDSGFSSCNTIFLDCKKKKPSKTCLFKENYLSEFKSPTEKALARFNLGVYSILEIDNKIKNIISDTSNFITKIDLDNRLANLDFVDSKLKAYLNYQIPVNLFKL